MFHSTEFILEYYRDHNFSVAYRAQHKWFYEQLLLEVASSEDDPGLPEDELDFLLKVSEGKGSEVLRGYLDQLLATCFFSDINALDELREKIDIAFVESSGLVPCVHPVPEGFVILIPAGFILTLLQLVDALWYPIGPMAINILDPDTEGDFQQDKEEAHQILFDALSLMFSATPDLAIFDRNRKIRESNGFGAPIDYSRRMLEFLILHELAHIIRGHSFETAHRDRPFRWRRYRTCWMHELEADAFAFGKCLNIEQIDLWKRGIHTDHESYEKEIHYGASQYVYVIQCFFDLVYILETIVHHRTPKSKRSHPPIATRLLEFSRIHPRMTQMFSGRHPSWVPDCISRGAHRKFCRDFLRNHRLPLEKIVFEAITEPCKERAIELFSACLPIKNRNR